MLLNPTTPRGLGLSGEVSSRGESGGQMAATRGCVAYQIVRRIICGGRENAWNGYSKGFHGKSCHFQLRYFLAYFDIF